MICHTSPVRLVFGSSGISAVERPEYKSWWLKMTSVTAAAECVYRAKLWPPCAARGVLFTRRWPELPPCPWQQENCATLCPALLG